MRSNTDTQRITSLKIVRAGLFIAVSLVLKVTFEIYIPLAGISALRINFASIPIMMSGIILGPAVGFLTGASADIINFMMKPVGPYFPGFTLVSALNGFIPGIIYKYIKKDINYNLVNTIFISLLSAGYVVVLLSKGLLKFDNGIMYNGEYLSLLYVIGFLILIAVYMLLPIILKLASNDLSVSRIVFTTSLTQLITSIILNTYFLSVLYCKGFIIFLPARILTSFFMIPIYSITMAAVLNTFDKAKFKI